jgi:hypothetical protein
MPHIARPQVGEFLSKTVEKIKRKAAAEWHIRCPTAE